ncbi:MAG: Gfo/Idh/MocA family oxidoreductase [Clostridia bacterium]|nr:Gfo/Idh/MocA family oxidoreductase [Clostridia bacterium]
MKICFIGSCGHWRRAFRVLKERRDAELCGFAPGSEEENQKESIDSSIPHFEHYREMLDQTMPDLAIVSPVFGITGKIIIECAKRGIDVFAEKPVATSLEELELVEKTVKESGIRFCAMHYLRFTPAFYHGAKMVRDGMIGELKMITAQKSYVFGTRPDWYSIPELYGGTIPWVGIHAIDWISYFSGKRFQSVTAQSSGNSPEMAALCQFTLENGLIAAANLDFYRPDSAPTHGDDRVRCVGTEGVLEVRDGRILLMNKDGISEHYPDSAPELLTSFLNGEDPLSQDEIFHITKVAISARESAKSGTTVTIGE